MCAVLGAVVECFFPQVSRFLCSFFRYLSLCPSTRQARRGGARGGRRSSPLLDQDGAKGRPVWRDLKNHPRPALYAGPLCTARNLEVKAFDMYHTYVLRPDCCMHLCRGRKRRQRCARRLRLLSCLRVCPDNNAVDPVRRWSVEAGKLGGELKRTCWCTAAVLVSGPELQRSEGFGPTAHRSEHSMCANSLVCWLLLRGEHFCGPFLQLHDH